MSVSGPPPSWPPAGANPSDPYSGGVPAKAAKAPKTVLIVGLVLLALSLGSCVYGGAKLSSTVTQVRDALDTAESQPSGTIVTVEDAEGLIMIFADSERMTCQVKDQTGAVINENVDNPAGSYETSGSRTQFFIQGFEAKPTNSYEVTCSDPAEQGYFVVVNVPDLSSAIAGVAGIGIGILVFVVGGICLIVGLISRGKWKRNNAPRSDQPPGGNYPPGPSQGWTAPGGPGPMTTPPAPGGYGGPVAPTPGAPASYPPPPGQTQPNPTAPVPPASPTPPPIPQSPPSPPSPGSTPGTWNQPPQSPPPPNPFDPPA
ncbi:MAG: hypothetical protein KDB26_03325 [Microthrixaceae bacterium]|nr:hypothetical protein [Microthrixaceae bacterium]